jgi:hypothetical protein
MANRLLLSVILLILMFICTTFAGVGYALDKTPTGFFYPTGVAQFDSQCGTWLSRDPANQGCYFAGEYHIGIDIMTTVGATDRPVYPITDGTITNISSSGWGTGNVAAVVKHKLAGGGEFLTFSLMSIRMCKVLLG